ncbi:unnamed protein product [Moneuplotes crassus]|uniref:Ribosomal protein L13 n=1 Tax=Euplotes crassus TaxID=5936 RepID=A0AAD1XJX5_EUPCR|nr:unnamed protein product [Moneuplotes crassus]
MYSARRCFCEKPKIGDFITDNRLYDKHQRMKDPEFNNVSYNPSEELYKPPNSDTTRMIMPKVDPVKFLRLYGITYENFIKAQSAYFCVKRQDRIWHVFDASRIPLGRMAGRIAKYITGKYKPTYDPKRVLLNNDRVLVVNGSNIRLTGKQRYQKVFRHHTGYAGALHEILFKDLEKKDPQELIRRVVKGMIAPNNTRKLLLDRIKVFPDQYHTCYHLKIPQFINQPLPDPNEMVSIPADLDDLKKNYVVVAEEVDNNAEPYDIEELRDVPREYDENLFIPRNVHNLDYKKHPELKNINKREIKKYKKKSLRMREYK